MDLTQAELARRVGCATVTIRKIEYDSLRPSQQIAELLAKSLAIPLEERAAFVRLARMALRDTPEPSPLPTPPPTPDEIGGQDLSGRAIRGYALGERIGAGGFGAVYRAVQPLVEREVAVKIILPQYADHPEFIRRFEAEAQVVARLEHPHIVPLYDYWREPGVAYLVMRLLRGGSLQASLEDGPLALETVIHLLEQIGAALHMAHRAGVIHRDLKPANVLLDEDGNGYLADFGIAKNLNLEDQTQVGAVIGSPAYLSPEQILSEPVKPQADVYSLGVMLYELLTGQKPFKGPTPIDLIQQHLDQTLPPLATQHPGLPAALDAVIERATAKKPLDRYPDVPSLLADYRTAVTPATEAAQIPYALAIPDEGLENPYKGLRAFGEADAGDFFGRSTLTQELLGRVAEAEDASTVGQDLARFLAVVGPSGSGKSSVVKAGIIPALRRGGLPGSENWFIVDLLPGAHPWEELEAALLRIAVNPPESLLAQLLENERGLLRAVRRVLPADGETELVLVIDQFEEVFTLCADETVRAHFMDSLVTAVLDPRSRLRVIITLRADFTDRPLQYVDFGELVRQRTEFVLPLSPDEMEEAIIKPAERVGLVVEPGLAETITSDLGDQPGMLPLLQYTLTELFERRVGRGLTLGAYQASGGVRGALASRADELYAQLDEVGQKTARQLFLRLITPGEISGEGLTAPDTRRRVLRSELASVDGRPATNADGLQSAMNDHSGLGRSSLVFRPSSVMDTVIDTFGRHRLLTFDRDPATRGPTVEVAHEALIREWGRLRGWLEEDREFLLWGQRLRAALHQWEASQGDEGALLRGAPLAEAENWYNQRQADLSQAERDFIHAGLDLREQRAAEREAQRQRELEAAQKLAEAEKQRAEEQARAAGQLRKRAVFLGVALGIAGVLAVVALIFGQQAGKNEQEALRQASIGLAALAEGELGGVDQERSVLLALEAVEHYPFTAQAAGALAQSIEAFRAFRVLDSSESVAGLISVAAWSPDGERIAGATGPSPDSVVIWDAATGGELLTINSHDGLCREDFNLFHDLAWSPASDHLAVAAQDTNSGAGCGTVVLDAANGERLLVLKDYESAARSLDWSPDGTILLTGHEDGSARLWNTQSGELLQPLTGHSGTVFDAVFSPDGRRIATASEDGTVRLWDAETGIEQIALRGHAGVVKSVAWSPDATRLVTGGIDGLPRVWDAVSGEVLLTFPGHVEDVVIVTWSADGRRIASQGLDAIIKVWDAATGGLLFQLTNAAPEPTTKRGFVEFSPGGEWILAGGTRVLGVRLWDASIPVPKLFGHTFGQEWGGWSPNGTLIATSGSDGEARLWDAVTGQQVGEFPGGSFWGRWSPDGAHLVFADGIGPYTLNVWDVKSREILTTLSAPEDANGAHQFLTVDWSPDGSMIAAADFRPGTTSQALYIWDVETAELIAALQTDDNCMLGWPRWSPDSARIATGCIFVDAGANTPARIWDVASGQEIMRLESEYGWTYRTVWSPDGTRILITYEQGVARVWDVETGEPTLTFAGHQGSVDGEWSPDGTLIASTGFANKSVKIWDSETGKEFLSFSVPGAPLTIGWSPDGTHVIVTGDGINEPIIKRIWHSTQELIEHAYDCCVSRELTPEERAQFGLPERP
jgi:WD40 repeat protein/transcriptional regulator with XRE-family HTH domain